MAGAGARLEPLAGEMPAERPRPRHGAKNAEHMPGDRMQPLPAPDLPLDIGDQGFERLRG